VLVVIPLPLSLWFLWEVEQQRQLAATQVVRVCSFSRQFLSTILVVLLVVGAVALAVLLIFPSRVLLGGAVAVAVVEAGQPILPAGLLRQSPGAYFRTQKQDSPVRYQPLVQVVEGLREPVTITHTHSRPM
jgi:hypothetical protein